MNYEIGGLWTKCADPQMGKMAVKKNLTPPLIRLEDQASRQEHHH